MNPSPPRFAALLLAALPLGCGAEVPTPARADISSPRAEAAGLLNAHSYEKGAWVLHMLRRELGDAAFFEGLRRYYEAFRFRNATTDDVRRTMEAAAGQDLRPFFDQWLRRADEPDLDVTWRWDGSALAVTVRQRQPGPPFSLPLDIGVRAAGEAAYAVHPLGRLTEREQTFRVPLPAAPEAVVVDPDVWALAAIQVRPG